MQTIRRHDRQVINGGDGPFVIIGEDQSDRQQETWRPCSTNGDRRAFRWRQVALGAMSDLNVGCWG
jgi:hypothetical protein